MTQTNKPNASRILVIDDNEAIHDDFRKILGGTQRSSSLAAFKTVLFGEVEDPCIVADMPVFEVDTASQGREGYEKVAAALAQQAPYAIAFVDMRMPPGWDGLETIGQIWQSDPDIQTVICTAYSDYSLEQITCRLGCSDRLLILRKPFDAIEIQQLASNLSEKWKLKQQAAMRMEQMERLVEERTAQIGHALLHDRLTDLPNRTLLIERLNVAMERRSRRFDYKFAVLFLDFDRFKLINDSLGHEVGDLVLIEIARRLRESLRATDLVSPSSMPARLGGDEFIVLLDDLREGRDAARIADRLLKVLAEPYRIDQQELHLTASIGIATSDRGYTQAGDILRDADTAMYRAKAAGRARYVMFDARMHEEVTARLTLENALRKAVQDSELLLHYQPIQEMASGRLMGFEALIRWNHPERGLLPGSELIPVAEETGLILPLGLWVLNEACEQLKTWRERYPQLDALTMSVNLSRRQLLDPGLANSVGDVIQRVGVPAERIVLEITETTVFDHPTDALATFDKLKCMGVWLHLDDFGIGHSSISCLYQLPLSGVKIDRAFLQHACERAEHAVVLESIMHMAKAFHLTVIAEGVETQAQLDLLRRLKCDCAQGYYFGRPTDADEAEAFIQRALMAGSCAAKPVSAS